MRKNEDEDFNTWQSGLLTNRGKEANNLLDKYRSMDGPSLNPFKKEHQLNFGVIDKEYKAIDLSDIFPTMIDAIHCFGAYLREKPETKLDGTINYKIQIGIDIPSTRFLHLGSPYLTESNSFSQKIWWSIGNPIARFF